MGGMGARGPKGAVLVLEDGSDVGGHEMQNNSARRSPASLRLGAVLALFVRVGFEVGFLVGG